MKRIAICWLGTWLVVLSACGTPATSTRTGTQAEQYTNPVEVTGSIHIAGSSTVYPLTLRLAHALTVTGAPTDVAIDNVGTGGGFRAFCSGQAVDIVNASRPITANEQTACLNKGRTPVPFQIGYDALTIAISKRNTFVDALSVAQLQQIFSGAATTWNQVDARYPAVPIELYSPGKDSGTFDYFVEVVLTGDPAQLARTAKTSEDDNLLVKGIESNPNAIGYFGYAYYQYNDANLRAVPIRGNPSDEAVPPSELTVAKNSYPFVRPLFIYSDTKTIQEKPYVAYFIRFYLDNVSGIIRDVGYFPEQPATIDKARAMLEQLRV